MDESLQEKLWAACRDSPLFWVNAFGWTYRPKKPDASGNELTLKDEQTHWPMITWPVQDEFFNTMNACIELGEDAIVEKSRDMGASWMGLFVLAHRWLFVGNQSFLLMSRKEEYVDSRGDLSSLFEKLRYMFKWMPRWLRPKVIRDSYMHYENRDNGSVFTGESTNINAGQGARKTAAFLDEWARVPNAEEIALALADATACRIYNSTHQGPGTHFHKLLAERKTKALQMPWWRHPDKAIGAKQIADDQGRIRWTSPWYEAECARRSPKDIAQNLDMDAGSSGDIFFDAHEIDRHRRDHERTPNYRGSLKMLVELTETEKKGFINAPDCEKLAFVTDWQRGNLRLWCELDEETGRPSQQYTYAIGVDISNGSGNSNSVATIICKETNEIVAKLWDAHLSPEQLAETVMILGSWFGGLWGPAFLCWENNGPGAIFGKKVTQWRYRHFYVQKIDNVVRESKTQRFGWHSTKERKEVLLARYRECIATNKIIVHCQESLEEALDYIYDNSGLLIPGKLREEEAGGRELHGDHVIADALAVLARDELPKQRQERARPPAGSFAARREEKVRQRKHEDPWRI